jgi:hypothetical protein
MVEISEWLKASQNNKVGHNRSGAIIPVRRRQL